MKSTSHAARSPAMLVALLAASLRAPHKWKLQHMSTARALLQQMEISNVPGAQVVVAAFDHLNRGWWNSRDIGDVRQAESNLTSVTRRMELPIEELLWLLLSMPSEYRGYWRQRLSGPFLIEICLAILSNRASKYYLKLWSHSPLCHFLYVQAAFALTVLNSYRMFKPFSICQLVRRHSFRLISRAAHFPALPGRLCLHTSTFISLSSSISRCHHRKW